VSEREQQAESAPEQDDVVASSVAQLLLAVKELDDEDAGRDGEEEGETTS
jgi:hypothetical protein